MSFFKQGYVALAGWALLGWQAFVVFNEYGLIKAAANLFNLWQIYEFIRDHIWKVAPVGPVVDFFSHPATHALLIAAGIALIVWDNRRNKSLPPSPILPGAVEPISVTPKPNPTEPTPPVSYTSNERERLLEALHDVHSFVNGEPLKIALELNRLRDRYYAQIEEKGATAYKAELDAVVGRLQEFWGQYNDFIHQKYRLYQNEIRYALNVDRLPLQISPMLIQFSQLVSGLPEKPEHKTVRILDEPFGALLDTNGVEFGAWHSGANDRIQSMTENLRKSGVTGLEKTT